MRIISNIRDYYDFVGNIYDLTKSDKVVYDRTERSISEIGYKWDMFSGRYYGGDNYHVGFVWFCGKFYPIYFANKFNSYYTKISDFEIFHNLEDVHNFLGVVDIYRIRGDTKRFNKLFEKLKEKFNSTSPIVALLPDGKVIADYCRLAELKFSKILSPEQAYQELDMWISNERNIEKDVVFDDVHKRNSHGFVQCSFKSCHPARK